MNARGSTLVSPRPRWWRRKTVLVAFLLFGLTLTKGMAWAAVIPIGMHPDEPAHAAYADSIGNTLSLRQGPRAYNAGIDPALIAAEYGRQQANTAVKLPFDERSLAEREDALEAAIPLREDRTTLVSHAGAYPPLYYFASGLVVRSTQELRYDATWYLERGLSALIASLTIVVQFGVLLAVFAGSVTRAGVSAFVLTMMPMYTAMESAINPEVLVVLWGSIVLLIAMRLVDQPYRWALHVGAGVVIAAGLITKPNAAVLVAPYVVAAIVGAVRHRTVFTPAKVLARAGAFLAPLLVIYGAWRMIPAAVPGSGGATASWPAIEVNGVALRGLFDFVQAQGRWRFSDLYWGYFGWVDTPMPAEALLVGFWFSAAVVVVLIIAALNGAIPARVWVCASAIVALLALVLFIEYLATITLANGFIQGRYFFPVAVAIVALQMWAVDYAFRARWRLRAAAWCMAPVVVSGFHLIAVLRTVIPRYYL